MGKAGLISLLFTRGLQDRGPILCAKIHLDRHIMVVPAANATGSSPYQFKSSPYSSHSLLLAAFPQRGEGRRVLDLGCAEGYLSAILAERGFRVTGVEGPGGAGDHFPESVHLVEADLDLGLPPLQPGFDFIVCADVLEHLRDPLRILAALRGLLAPGGALIASLPNSGHAYFRWNILLGRFPAHDRGLFDRTHLHFFTWDGWLNLFQRAGLQIESVKSSGVPVGLALPRWDGSLPVHLLERLSYELARHVKRLFAYQFIVTARPEVA